MEMEPSRQTTAPEAKTFEPTIIAFVCNWCTYTAADLAGTARMVQKPNVRLVRMMCTGMVDPKYVLKALLSGADGVLVSGCHPGDCHYINGNYKARRRIKLLKELVDRFGLDERRLKLTWVGASEGNEFAAVVNHMIEDIRALGPNPARGLAVI
jgi:coenzyme F420-reducing hydrogenase delta subunit